MMRKDRPEPLNELLFQEFPKTDPVEIERITRTVERWLEQERKYFEKLSKKVAKEYGEKATPTSIARTYPRCIEALLQELNPQAYPLRT